VNWSVPRDNVTRIQCWSGPRNISTALMYSWRQRADTTVVDEPLYAHYLTRDDRGHPGVGEILASQQQDPDEVIRDVILGSCPTPVLYVKQMAHHLNGVDRTHLARTKNIILVRHPRDMLASLEIQLPNCDITDTGLNESVALLDAVLSTGGDPVVIESRSLLDDPAATLSAVCEHVGLEFDPAVLSWPAGPKPEDGAWAKHWYRGVHASQGFAAPTRRERRLSPRTERVLEEAMPLYERLAAHAIQPATG